MAFPSAAGRDTVAYRGECAMRHEIAAVVLAASAAVSMPAEAQQPGRLISAAPIQEAPTGMQAWRVQY